MPRKKPDPPALTSRTLIPDPDGPVELFPLRPGGPLRFREATEEEEDLWLNHGGVKTKQEREEE